MPLSEPAARTPLHTRTITLQGYQREDGLFDVEAELADTKSYSFNLDDRGTLHPGDRLHHMRLRMTVDETLLIIACEAVTELGPFTICPQGAENFSRLAGLRIGRGFLKEAYARVAGVEGCTHLREVLQQVATVAFQTTVAVRQRGRDLGAGSKGFINSCFAYSDTGAVVKQRWPAHYKGA